MKGEETPCFGCEFEPPPVGPDNAAAVELYNQVFEGARDGNGALQFNVLIELMRAQGFYPDETRLTLRKVLSAEQLLARKRAEEHQRQMDKIEAERQKPPASRRPQVV